jgi:DNA repair protein RadC
LTDHQYVQLRLDVLKTETLPAGSRDIVQLLHTWGMAKEPQECAWVIAYDANGNLRNVVEVARGGHAELTVEIQPVLTAVLAVGAIAFTFVHNHPTMSPTPSTNDWELTQKMMTAANACGLVFEEHLIITPMGDYYSFRDAGLILPPAKRLGAPPMKAPKAATTRRSK